MALCCEIHLVSTSETLATALSDSLAGKVKARVVPASRIPALSSPLDLIVVDFANLPSQASAHEALIWAQGDAFWALVGSRPLMPEWIPVLRHSGVHVISISQATLDIRELSMALREVVCRTGCDSLVDLVLRAEPFLKRLEPAVHAILANPWTLRRPRDLASYLEMGFADLRSLCRSVGFRRVEHLLIAVRMIAFEQLVARAGTTVRIAREAVGIDDPSNARKQLNRARRYSRTAFRSLRTFAA